MFLFNHSVDFIIIHKLIIIIVKAIPPPVAITIILKNSVWPPPKVGIRTISNDIRETKLVITFITFEDVIKELLYLPYWKQQLCLQNLL